MLAINGLGLSPRHPTGSIGLTTFYESVSIPLTHKILLRILPL